MMAVVMTAKRRSLISSAFGFIGIFRCSNELRLGLPEAGVSSWVRVFRGRHFDTASTLARQGCTCNGYENMTRMTMAARPMVEKTEGVYWDTMLPAVSDPKER